MNSYLSSSKSNFHVSHEKSVIAGVLD